MSKSLSKEERKNNKYISREKDRRYKYADINFDEDTKASKKISRKQK